MNNNNKNDVDFRAFFGTLFVDHLLHFLDALASLRPILFSESVSQSVLFSNCR